MKASPPAAATQVRNRVGIIKKIAPALAEVRAF
jgi:hypothetical protein